MPIPDSPEPIDGKRHQRDDGGCPHFKDGRCRILNEDVEKLNKAAEDYDESGESEADEEL